MRASDRTTAISFTAGLILIAAALGLFAYNSWVDKSAGAQAGSLLEDLRHTIAAGADPTGAIEEKEADSSVIGAVGVLSIPDLALELPVLAELNDSNLERSICLYSEGESGRKVIGGHNYKSHFGNIPSLKAGSPVAFTGLDGDTQSYRVSAVLTINANDFEALNSGDWDMTLFTCNFARDKRILVRLRLAEA